MINVKVDSAAKRGLTSRSPGFEGILSCRRVVMKTPIFSEGNRFQDECQNLTGDIFMARIRVLVYSIRLDMLWRSMPLPEKIKEIFIPFGDKILVG
jgi:hypothetical protein